VADNGRGMAWRGALLVLLSVVLACLTVWVATRKHPNTFAAALIQGMTIVSGTVGSYIFAKASVRDAARELIRLHARSAFRRIRGIYSALAQLYDLIEDRLADLRLQHHALRPGTDTVDYEQVHLTLIMLQHIVAEQANTLDDALDDWRDIVPDEIKVIEENVKRIRGDRYGS
jgi:hypothetical protein